MIKTIRILEVPIYLLVIGMFCIENNSIGVGILLSIISVARLIVNIITDNFIYKNE